MLRCNTFGSAQSVWSPTLQEPGKSCETAAFTCAIDLLLRRRCTLTLSQCNGCTSAVLQQPNSYNHCLLDCFAAADAAGAGALAR